jgi:CxxC motif-containing protein
MKLLCKIGIHRPLKVGKLLFTDRWGCEVHLATCPCGKTWMTDGGPWKGYKCVSLLAREELDKMKRKEVCKEEPFDRETLIRILKDIKTLDPEIHVLDEGTFE